MEKRLYKSNKNKMIDGVCAGIAEYFNIDPTLVRLGAVVLTCAGGRVSWHILSQRSLSLEIQTEGDNDGARNPTDAFGADDPGGKETLSLPKPKENARFIP